MRNGQIQKKNIISGECIGITLSNEIFVDKGDLASDVKSPPKLMNRFEANLFWLSNKKISFDRKYKLKINSAEFDVNVREVKKLSIPKILTLNSR